MKELIRQDNVSTDHFVDINEMVLGGIQQIANEHHIDLYLDVRGESNSGFCSRANNECKAEIYISLCDSVEIQKAIFFHELGHILQKLDNYSFPHQFHYELDAWLTGLKIGYDYGYFIDPNIFFEILVPNLKSYQTHGINYKLINEEK
jgi:hypothetical protein